MNPQQTLDTILQLAGLGPSGSTAVIEGDDPVMPTRFRLGTAAAAAIAATGVAAGDLWSERGGERQKVRIDMRRAAAALRSDRYLRIGGEPPPTPWGDISGVYETKDGRWVQIHCNFPHHRDGTASLLGVAPEREQVAEAVRTWNGLDLSEALAEAGMCAALIRSRDEWNATLQGQATAHLPLFEVIRIGDGDRVRLPEAERPLSGVRVLDLTRVLAGPVAGRTLAEHGADVLRITSKDLPGFPNSVDIDTGHGKLSADLDLRSGEGRAQLEALTAEADVFLQSYRPGALDAKGFSPEHLAQIRPGIVYVTLSAYSHVGPWAGRRGFDSLVQSASGFVHEQSGGATPPRHLPAQVLDYVTGYLLAFGAMVALRRRAREGGSWLVRCSLVQTANWLWNLGRTDYDAEALPALEFDDVADLLTHTRTKKGEITHLAPVLQMSETTPRWERPSSPLGSDPARWP
jgi:crotonobetainyl-CoA:carnitine CoA-transferase CaiB-like acyl-CoA transferase